jgi:hypothetical protein
MIPPTEHMTMGKGVWMGKCLGCGGIFSGSSRAWYIHRRKHTTAEENDVLDFELSPAGLGAWLEMSRDAASEEAALASRPRDVTELPTTSEPRGEGRMRLRLCRPDVVAVMRMRDSMCSRRLEFGR